MFSRNMKAIRHRSRFGLDKTQS